MPSIFSHAVVPIAASLGLGKVISRRLLVFSAFCAILPDFDTLAFKFGIPYSSQWGHRGFAHSIAFAVCVAFVSMCFSRQLKSKVWLVGLMAFLATVSHPLLDMCTNGGLGVALYWPYSNERGFTVMKSEFLWVWLPSIILLFTLRGIRRK